MMYGRGDVWFTEEVAGLVMAQGAFTIQDGVVVVSKPEGQRWDDREADEPTVNGTPFGQLIVPMRLVKFIVTGWSG